MTDRELLKEKIEEQIYDIANENSLPPLFVDSYCHSVAANRSLDDLALLRSYYLRLSLDFCNLANTCTRSRREESREYGAYLQETISEAWLKETTKQETDMMIYFAIKFQNTADLKQYHAEALEAAKDDLRLIVYRHSAGSIEEAINQGLIFSFLPLITTYRTFLNSAA